MQIKDTLEELRDMLKLIPMGIEVCLEDLEEIYGIRLIETMENS